MFVCLYVMELVLLVCMSISVVIYSLQSLYLYSICIAYRNQCVCVFFNMYLFIKSEVCLCVYMHKSLVKVINAFCLLVIQIYIFIYLYLDRSPSSSLTSLGALPYLE